MKKFFTLLIVLTGLVSVASAATSKIYYAVSAEVVNYGAYTVQINLKISESGWSLKEMTKTEKTYFGNYVYEVEVDFPYNGYNNMQFWVNGAVKNDVYAGEWNTDLKNNKMYDFEAGWKDYNYDKTVTIHCKKDGDWIPTNCHNYFYDGSSDVPETGWPGNATTQSTLNGDWYDYTITGRPCTAMIFHNNNGNQTPSIPVGNATEYWVVNGVSSTTALSEVPASYNYTRSITDGKFGTICLPYNATITGATVYEISSKIMDGETFKGVNLTEVPGNTIVAGRAYIFKGTSSTLTATLSGNYADVATGNAMMGSYTGTTVPGGKYIVYQNKIREAGTGVTVGQYKGYIVPEKISEASSRSANYLSFEDETTGITGVEMNDDAEQKEVYNLNGQRVMNPSKGLYIVNGKKVIIK